MAYLKLTLNGVCKAKLADGLTEAQASEEFHAIVDKVTRAWDALREDPDLFDFKTEIMFEQVNTQEHL